MGRCFNGGGDPWDGFILDQINGQGQNDPGGNLVDQLLQGRASRSTPISRAPRLASNSAVARPMPDDAPVTTARYSPVFVSVLISVPSVMTNLLHAFH
jgi:hypothetical protein